jgi:hypothetical protein
MEVLHMKRTVHADRVKYNKMFNAQLIKASYEVDFVGIILMVTS